MSKKPTYEELEKRLESNEKAFAFSRSMSEANLKNWQQSEEKIREIAKYIQHLPGCPFHEKRKMTWWRRLLRRPKKRVCTCGFIEMARRHAEINAKQRMKRAPK